MVALVFVDRCPFFFFNGRTKGRFSMDKIMQREANMRRACALVDWAMQHVGQLERDDDAGLAGAIGRSTHV